MTGGTIGVAADLILFDQFEAAPVLVGRRLPGHVETSHAAGQSAPAGGGTPSTIPCRATPFVASAALFNLAMAGRAADAFLT